MTEIVKKNADLPVRVASAVVMVAVAGTALWLGGVWFDGFVCVAALACYLEFARLIIRAFSRALIRAAGLLAGALYIGAAAWFLIQINTLSLLLLIFGVVISVDVFAYFFGRSIGGPKIAPRISPSKTWAGLCGGAVGATAALLTYSSMGSSAKGPGDIIWLVVPGAALAVLAQAGDFFESWLKRRANMKDSSNLIPGHGGIFDRLDGMLPVIIVCGFLLTTMYPHWLNQ